MGERYFSGDPQTHWLNEAGPDRNMELTGDFWFVDAKGRKWSAPTGSIINGASIPRFLWATIGSPYTGDYRRASIVHDVACDIAGTDAALRLAADKMFFEACRAGGCSKWDATILYVGVRFGAWYGHAALLGDPPVMLEEPTEYYQLRQDFRQVSADVLRRGETDDADEIEARANEAFAALAVRKSLLLDTAASFAAVNAVRSFSPVRAVATE